MNLERYAAIFAAWVSANRYNTGFMRLKLLVILGSMLVATGVLAEETKTKTIDVAFSNYTAGTQYADNEKHDLGGGLVIYTTDCHFTTELRIYSSNAYNGYVVSDPLPGVITSMSFMAAYLSNYGVDELQVYGSTDGTSWTSVKSLKIDETSYNRYTCKFSTSLGYKCFKLDVKGDNQLRIKSMSITYVDNGNSGDDGETEEGEGDQDPETPAEPSEPNDGSKERPYTIAEVKAMGVHTEKKNKWVRGTIYGTIKDDISDLSTSNFTISSNIVIGDATAYIPIRLTDSEVRDQINLKEHPYLLGKELLVKGDLDAYFNVLGVTSPTQYEITYDVPINSFGYASLYLDIPVSMPNGSTAYYCSVNGDVANLHPIEGVVPDSLGIIVKSSPNTICKLTYTTEENSDETAIRDNNQLVGFAKETLVTADGNAYYALNAKKGVLGFYIPQTAFDEVDASAGFVAKANKAYLKVPTEQSVSMFVIHNANDETGIVSANRISDDVIYDLLGRVVSNPTSGVYIRNGVKIVVK